jgi:hypothetical protein
MIISYYEYVYVALVIQHMYSSWAILSSAACLGLPYLFTLPNKRHDFWKHLLNVEMYSDFL